jgi:hypothetical protein
LEQIPKTLANKPDQDLFNVIRNGKGKMPAEAEGRAKDDDRTSSSTRTESAARGRSWSR